MNDDQFIKLEKHTVKLIDNSLFCYEYKATFTFTMCLQKYKRSHHNQFVYAKYAR